MSLPVHLYSDRSQWELAGFPEDPAYPYWRTILDGRATRVASQLGHRPRPTTERIPTP